MSGRQESNKCLCERDQSVTGHDKHHIGVCRVELDDGQFQRARNPYVRASIVRPVGAANADPAPEVDAGKVSGCAGFR